MGMLFKVDSYQLLKLRGGEEMKKFLIILVLIAAMGPFYAIPEDTSPAWEQSGRGSIQNVNNNALRFGKGGRIAIPGEGGQHSDENSVVEPWSGSGSQSIVDPQGF